MSAAALFAAFGRRVTDAVLAWAPGGRRTWCRRHRRRLRSCDGSVIWVRGRALDWAKWGARRGYFTVEYMDGLAYLRSTPGSTA